MTGKPEDLSSIYNTQVHQLSENDEQIRGLELHLQHDLINGARVTSKSEDYTSIPNTESNQLSESGE